MNVFRIFTPFHQEIKMQYHEKEKNRLEDATRAQQYTVKRKKFWNEAAQNKSIHGLASRAYHQRIHEIFKFHIAPGQRVIEIGCGEGDLLASVRPSLGLGIDFAESMVQRARHRHPKIEFICADGLEFISDQKFDVVILSDVINDVWDIQTLLECIKCYSHSHTRILLNFYSRLWTPVLRAAEFLHLAQKPLEQNWVTVDDVRNLLYLTGFDVIRTTTEVFLPLPIPLIAPFFNQFLVRIWPFNLLALTNLMIARPVDHQEEVHPKKEYTVTVVVPARNEEGNIRTIFESVPMMGSSTELLFVEGNSKDDTYGEIQRQMELHPEIDSSLYRQSGKGKGDAVRLGFEKARGDILMILDADLTMPPEYLPRYYNSLAEGKGEFINGVRLVYPMEKNAMRLLNFLGNKFFSVAFTWLLGQPVKDTLCGTKVLFKKDYERIRDNRSYFGDFDPFGDFDLLFGSAKQNMKIVDIPIRYKERVYGTTNIQRWKHGWLLIKMVVFAALRLKFK
jgi:2-polyprenyl-3-methyl-5-hydroxy-6-metoxy-1,4-benzoquinol methylase